VLNKKNFYIVLFLTVIFLVVFGLALHFSVREMVRLGGNPLANIRNIVVFPQLLSLALYFSGFMVALMSVFSTVGSVSGEIESGTIQAVIAKPLKRTDFILGKFLGYAMMMSIYSAFLFLGVIGIMKLLTGYNPSNIVQGMALFVLIPFLLTALSLCGSSFLSTMANGITVFMLYVIGTVGGMVEQIGAIIENSALVNTGILSSLLIPTDALYRKMIFGLLTGPDNPINTLTVNPFATTSPPSGVMIIYAILYLILAVLAAVKIFSRRDI